MTLTKFKVLMSRNWNLEERFISSLQPPIDKLRRPREFDDLTVKLSVV